MVAHLDVELEIPRRLEQQNHRRAQIELPEVVALLQADPVDGGGRLVLGEIPVLIRATSVSFIVGLQTLQTSAQRNKRTNWLWQNSTSCASNTSMPRVKKEKRERNTPYLVKIDTNGSDIRRCVERGKRRLCTQFRRKIAFLKLNFSSSKSCRRFGIYWPFFERLLRTQKTIHVWLPILVSVWPIPTK